MLLNYPWLLRPPNWSRRPPDSLLLSSAHLTHRTLSFLINISLHSIIITCLFAENLANPLAHKYLSLFYQALEGERQQTQTIARGQFNLYPLVKVNHLSKVGEGVYAYVDWTLEIHRKACYNLGKSPNLSGPQYDKL